MKKLAHAFALVLFGAGIASGASAGCSGTGEVIPPQTSSTTSTTTSTAACDDGNFRHCDCPAGPEGTQACSNGTWGECLCDTPILDAGQPEAAAPACGDSACNGDETCATCPADCGACPACTLAPTCTGASSVPSSPTALPAFDNAGQSLYSSGVGMGTPPDQQTECSNPLLKMRLQQVKVHENGASHDTEIFCMIQADDGQSSQLVLTQSFQNVADDNPPLVIAPSAGTFWGEAVNGVKLSQFNITITYQCYIVLTPGTLEKALGAIAGVGGAGAAIPGNPYGWAFGVGGAAAAAIAAAVATGSGAAQLLNVQQTIDSGALLELTNGYTWTIRQSGTTKVDGSCGFFSTCDWDWELGIEAWGCAVPKGQSPK
jgi:hypothetical protein